MVLPKHGRTPAKSCSRLFRSLTTGATAFLHLERTTVTRATTAQATNLGPGRLADADKSNLDSNDSVDGSISYGSHIGASRPVDNKKIDEDAETSINKLHDLHVSHLNGARSGRKTTERTAASMAVTVWTLTGNDIFQILENDLYVINRASSGAGQQVKDLTVQFLYEAKSYQSTTGSLSGLIDVGPTNNYDKSLLADVPPPPQPAI